MDIYDVLDWFSNPTHILLLVMWVSIILMLLKIENSYRGSWKRARSVEIAEIYNQHLERTTNAYITGVYKTLSRQLEELEGTTDPDRSITESQRLRRRKRVVERAEEYVSQAEASAMQLRIDILNDSTIRFPG